MKSNAARYSVDLARNLEALEALPAQPQIALRLLQLGDIADVDFSEYVKLIQADPSLSSKVLAVANSAFHGVSNEVSTIKKAVGLLGISQVRAIAISACISGLHAVWRIGLDDSKALFEASLFKALAAELLAGLHLQNRAEETFTTTLFQDIAVGLFAAVGGEEYKARLRNPDCAIPEQLAYERELFGADHAAVSQLIGRKVGLPSVHTVATAVHHTKAELAKATGNVHLSRAIHVAALLPHDLRCWKHEDVKRLDDALGTMFAGHWADAEAFATVVEGHFGAFLKTISPSKNTNLSVVEIMKKAAVENAKHTAQFIVMSRELMSKNQTLSQTAQSLVEQHAAAEERADHDPLTGLLNRRGFCHRTEIVMADARRDGRSIGIGFFDLDNYKAVNDEHGHDCGDAVLREVAARVQATIRDTDVACRWGGDEIIVLFTNLQRGECMDAARTIQKAVEQTPVSWGDLCIYVAVSGGVQWVETITNGVDLEQLITSADEALNTAKSSSRGVIESTS